MRRALLLVAFASVCIAQAGRVEVTGSVQDAAGLPLAGAKVEAAEQSTLSRQTAQTDSRGEYHLLGLAAGHYILTVERAGFHGYRRAGLVLRSGDRPVINVRLEVGAVRDTVEVTAAAPLLQTASAEVAFNVDERKVEALPLDGRNFIPLVALSPGVALPGGGSLLPRINGSRPRTNEYIYDGISVLQPEPGQVAFYPIVDGIAELRLNVNAYSAEYGRSNGGTVLVIGKSGGNDLHGTLFEFFRNGALNARNYFAPAGTRPEFRRNQYGLVLGGPIQRNRTFFFVDWQGTRLRTAVTRLSTVPTASQRAGVFETAIYDPVTRQPLSSNTIPVNRLDPTGRQVLGKYPLPTSASAGNNYTRTAVEPDDQDQFDARFDRYFGSRHRLFGRYSFLRDHDVPVTPLPGGNGSITSGVTGDAITRGDSLVIEHAWTLTANALNQARFGYSRRDLRQASLQEGGIAVRGLPPNSFSSVSPIFNVAGYQQIGPTAAANSNFTTSVAQAQDTLSIVRRRHTFRLGADLRREALDVLNPANPTGSFTFNTTGTNSPAIPASGHSLASLLLGQVSAFSIDIQERPVQARAHIAEFLLADDWRMTGRLSVSAGVRYTLNFPSTELHDQGAVFNLSRQLLEFPHTARELECCNLGPRLGLAYRMGDSWVLRSGYGLIFFEQSGITTPFTMPQFPFVQTIGQQSQDNVTPAFVLANGPEIQVTPPNPNSGLGQGVFGVDRTNGSGYSQQWNFTIQKTFGNDMSFEASYLGSKNTRLGIPDANINQLPASLLSEGAALLARVPNPYFGEVPASSSLGAATITTQQLLRPFPRFTTVALFRNNVGSSKYNAVAARLEKRFSHGLTFTLAYTFSKLIDDASSVFSQTIFTGPVLNNTGAADAFNRHLEKDVSSGDIPRVFAAGWVYELPRIRQLRGWRIGGIVRVQSGDAVAVAQSTNLNANLGFAVQRPNRVSDPNRYPARTAGRWFDTGAFRQAGQFELGNSSRNPVRGPGLQNADLMIGKTFAVSERARLEVRAEAFNISNTPPLNDPNGSFGSAAFGSITTAGNPRVLEFAAKLHF